MTLRQLIDHVVSRGNFHKTITHLYHLGNTVWENNTEADVEKRYLKVVAELSDLEGTDTYAGDHIHVRSNVFEGQEQIDVVLCDDTNTTAMDFVDWNDIIDLQVKDDVSREISEMLAHVLYEITWWGMSRNSINEQAKEMVDEVANKNNLISFCLTAIE